VSLLNERLVDEDEHRWPNPAGFATSGTSQHCNVFRPHAGIRTWRPTAQ
jgi:hypothetical protein